MEQEDHSNELSRILDQLETLAQSGPVRVSEVIEKLGHTSFASLMLCFTLISASPASAIPGITAIVAAIVFILAVQMIAGRNDVWLPGVIARRRMSAEKLRKGIGWVRKPVSFVERFVKPRQTFLLKRPWILLPLCLVVLLTLAMPFLEVVPTSGSIASAVIAFFAAALLSRDGALVLVSLIPLAAAPAAIAYFGLG